MPERFSPTELTPRPTSNDRRSRSPRALVLTACGVLALAFAAAPLRASTQLSDGHVFSDVDFDKTSPKISPNGQWAVYGQDAVVDGAFELYSVPVAGGTPVRLSDVLTASQHVTFAISPNSARVVYMVDQDTLGKTELYSVPIGGGVSTKLNATLGTGRNVLNFQISPTSDRVFYVADQGTTQNVFHLYSVAINGGGSVRLSVDKGSQWDVENYKITSDGNTVAYRTVATAFGNGELWSVPAEGPAEVNVILNRALTSGGAVEPDFQISADDSRAIYRADASTDETFELYSVPIGGGTSARLNGSMAGDVTGFVISANSSRVVYRADQAVAATFQLYTVPIAGGTADVLNGTLGAGRDVEAGFSISGDSSRVIYRSDEAAGDLIELYSVPLADGTPIKLNSALNSAGDVLGSGPSAVQDPAVTADGGRVVYLADAVADGLNELYSVPIAGPSTAAVKLNRALAPGGDVQNFRLTPDSNWAIYGADGETDGTDELYAAPIAGGTVLDVSGPLVFGGDVILKYVVTPIVWEVSSNSRDVVYAADETFDDEIELYTASLGGPPSAPTAVTAVAGNTQVTVTFAAPTNNGGSPITGYSVTPSPATVGWVDNNAGSTALTHVIANLTNGTAYTFTVRATNVNGIGDPSAPSNVATPATVPSAPSAVGAVPRNYAADVTFAASASNGGSTITGYTVISNPAGGTDITQGTTALKHYVVGLTNGTPYTFTVVAHNVMGPSTASAASPAVTPGCVPDAINVFCDGVETNDTSQWSFATAVPGAPTSVVAAGGNAQATVTFDAPIVDPGNAVTGYTVTSSPAGGIDSNAGAVGLSHVVTSLVNGTAYTFTVRATNASGEGPASAPSNVVTPATVPGAPTTVVAVAGDGTATVVFDAPLDDGGSPILGYTVTSSPAGGTDSNAGEPGLTHGVTGLANGTEYTFTVTATNAAGTGDPSAPSNPVTPNPS